MKIVIGKLNALETELIEKYGEAVKEVTREAIGKTVTILEDSFAWVDQEYKRTTEGLDELLVSAIYFDQVNS